MRVCIKNQSRRYKFILFFFTSLKTGSEKCFAEERDGKHFSDTARNWFFFLGFKSSFDLHNARDENVSGFGGCVLRDLLQSKTGLKHRAALSDQ